MRILVVGSGGREHALTWKLRQSSKVTDLYCTLGNAGTNSEAKSLGIPENDHDEIVRFAKRQKITLAVIGPEAPLVAGLSNRLRAEGIAVFGPSKEAALLEGSKIFCKEVLQKAKAPTAAYRVFTNMFDVEEFLATRVDPCVVKVDGLAAGKGVVVCHDNDQAHDAARRMLVDQEFGAAGRKILIEDRVVGLETSVLAITDGKSLLILPACQDHKAVFDGDRGPNTGGMGAYCPTPILDVAMLQTVERDILVPVLHAMRQLKRRFQGVLYAGLMITPGGPKVLEFNVRFGDPECQPLLMRLQSDLAEVLLAAATGNLEDVALAWDARPAVCVVLASRGYPGRYPTGIPIQGIDQADAMEGVKVFHAGTKQENGHLVTSGGRVLGVTALGVDLRDAQHRAYRAVDTIAFEGMHYRKDIASKVIASHP